MRETASAAGSKARRAGGSMRSGQRVLADGRPVRCLAGATQASLYEGRAAFSSSPRVTRSSHCPKPANSA